MKILMFLTKLFKNDSRVYQEARALREAGNQIHIINWARHDPKKTLPPCEETSGITIHYIHDNKLIRNLKNTALKNPLWWIKAYKKALNLYKNGFTFNIVHCHDLDTLAIGVMLKRRLNIKLIYDAHEIFGYMIREVTSKLITCFAFWLERLLIPAVDRIVTVNEPLKNYFESISDKPITIVMNCKDLVNEKYISPNNAIFSISYIGILSRGRMFPEILDIIANIEGVKLIIAAPKENLYTAVEKKSKQYKNIEFLGTIPSTEVISKTLQSDLVICLFDPDNLNNKVGLPNKQFEAMVCGRPIITTKNTYAGNFTEINACGMTVEYNKESLQKAILTLKNNPQLCAEFGKNALKAAKEKYNWQNEKKKLLQVYKMLS